MTAGPLPDALPAPLLHLWQSIIHPTHYCRYHCSACAYARATTTRNYFLRPHPPALQHGADTATAAKPGEIFVVDRESHTLSVEGRHLLPALANINWAYPLRELREAAIELGGGLGPALSVAFFCDLAATTTFVHHCPMSRQPTNSPNGRTIPPVADRGQMDGMPSRDIWGVMGIITLRAGEPSHRVPPD